LVRAKFVECSRYFCYILIGGKLDLQKEKVK
jgi:hypothetical protein